MLKHRIEIFAVFISIFVIFTNFGYSVLDQKQNVNTVNVCCTSESITNSCCEIKDVCDVNKTNNCCCSESLQTIQFTYNVPVNEYKKGLIFFPIIVNLSFVEFFDIKFLLSDFYTFTKPPPKTNKLLSLLQTFRI